MNKVIDSLQKIAVQIEKEGHSLKWYIFGSFITQEETAMDIDILVLYNCLDSAKIVRNRLRELSLFYPLDILLMTKEEEFECNFVKLQKAKRIYP